MVNQKYISSSVAIRELGMCSGAFNTLVEKHISTYKVIDGRKYIKKSAVKKIAKINKLLEEL